MEGIEGLGLTQENIRVLGTARFYFQKHQKVRKVYSSSICDKAVELISQCQVIQGDNIDGEEINKLQAIEGIDPGEQVLIAGTKNETDFYLGTGDKRCLMALGSRKNLDEIRERLRGKVVCLEQVIWRLIEVKGFEEVKNKVLPARESDLALKTAFGSGERATLENVRMTLEGYIEDLQEKSQGLLVDHLLLQKEH